MSNLFTITPDIRLLAQNAIDTMISQLGKMCLLVFDSQATQCPNCHYDPVAKASTGVYNPGGPRPFTHPPCPVCRGRGLVDTQETTQEVQFLIDWQPKPWLFMDTTGTVFPQGLVQTKGFVEYLPAVKQAKWIVIDHENAKYETNRFKLWGEPIPQGNIVSSRYMVAFWSRYGS